jgi:hypothetical protein
MLIQLIVFAAIWFCVSVTAHAQSSAPPLPAETRIDIWKRYMDIRPLVPKPPSESAGEAYWVVLAARQGVPGHAFVLWISQDWFGQHTSVEAFGMYPTVTGSEALKSAFGSVPGALRDEITKREMDGCCNWSSPDVFAVFRVDFTTFERTTKIRQEWNATASQFQLVEKDCVTFLMDVGGGMGFEMPSRTVLNADPVGYVKSFLQRLGGTGTTLHSGADVYTLRSESKNDPVVEGWTVMSTDLDKPPPRSTGRPRFIAPRAQTNQCEAGQ